MVAFFIIGWVLVKVAEALAFDKLLHLEYTLHRRDWEKDGRPSGTFWSPPEVRPAGLREFFGGTFARRRVGPGWFFSTPAWVKQRREARAWLYAFRGVYLASYLLPIGAFLYLIWVT